MNALKAVELIKQNVKCRKCGSETIGNGAGGIDIDITFTRSCKCGYSITLDEDGKELD